MKSASKYIGTVDRRYFVEENYTYADTPMTIKNMARHLGINYKALCSFIRSHNLGRKIDKIEKVNQLLSEGYLSIEQIENITGFSKREIEKIRKEKYYEQNLE